MMLYVFHVETGKMMVFEMALAVECVTDLKLSIEKKYQISSEQQVLLVSGGITLDDNSRVCTYSSGVDTNPIFLFDKSKIEAANPNQPYTDAECYVCNIDFTSKVVEGQNLPATYDTVVHRANLAQQFLVAANMLSKSCEELVHDQHLQQQGWAAVIANLEDLTDDFKKKSELSIKNFRDYLQERDRYLNLLKHFQSDLETLSKVPIMPMLLEKYNMRDENTNGKTEVKESEETAESSANLEKSTNLESSANLESLTSLDKPKTSLLDWISSADTQSTMDILYDHCGRGLDQFNEECFKDLELEIKTSLETSQRPELKEIKGLADRLFNLDKLMEEARKCLRDQKYVTQGFLQNQNRAGNLGDTSILPDLCDSHKKQLSVMLQNHDKLCDIQKRCLKAKNELCGILYQRLKWVMHVESCIQETSHKLIAYHDNLKRLRQHLEVIQQIHLTPAIYLAAIAEVVRRRTFSEAFLIWASELACHLLTIYNEEITKRKEFQTKFEGHFLNVLFPGMEDLPSAFATQAPSIFDSSLPKISMEDIDELKKAIPEWADELDVPDMSAITNFFLSKSVVKNEDDKEEDCDVEEKLVQVVSEVGLASNLDQKLLKPGDSEPCLIAAHGLAHLKDLDKGFESETDTEEFEKVCQSPQELLFDKDLSASRQVICKIVATEDNLKSSRLEQKKLKEMVIQVGLLSYEALVYVRKQMDEIKNVLSTQKATIDSSHEEISTSWKTLSSEYDNNKEEVRKIETKYAQEVELLKKTQYLCNEEVKCLREENSCLDSSLNKLADQNKELLDKLAKSEDEIEVLKTDRNQAVKETEERLMRTHKLEVDNLRKKFRLMTEADRSPSSDSILEKSLDADLLRQIKESCDTEKAKALEELRAHESKKFEKLLEEQLKALNQEAETVTKDLNNKIQEKDLLIKTLLEREANLKLECLKYKNINEQLTESHRDLEEKLKKEEHFKAELEAQLNISTSFISLSPSKMDASTSPCRRSDKTTKSDKVTRTDKMARSFPSGTEKRKLSIDSCNINDNVLVLWTPNNSSFSILQTDSSQLHFVNNDCLNEFCIKRPRSDSTELVYFLATVTNKEFCQTRKAENRFNVPKGTQFYRVKVKPLTHPLQQALMNLKEEAKEPLSDTNSQSLSSSSTKDESTSQIQQ